MKPLQYYTYGAGGFTLASSSHSVVMPLAPQAFDMDEVSFDMHKVSPPFTSCILFIPLHHCTLWPGTQASIPGNYPSFTSTEYTLRFQLAYGMQV